MKRYLTLAAATLVFVPALVTHAQGSVSTLLPEASEIGPDWFTIESSYDVAWISIDELPSVADAAVAAYGGPGGARIIVFVYQVAEGDAAVRDSWISVGQQFDDLQLRFVVLPGIEEDFRTVPPPEGCTNARRVRGADALGGPPFPVSMTLCASERGVLVLALVSGNLDAPNGGIDIRSPLTAVADDIVLVVLGDERALPPFTGGNQAPRPAATAGRLEAVHVTDALAGQGLAVEQNQGFIPAGAFSVPGQGVTVDGTQLFIFIFPNAATPTAELASVDPATVGPRGTPIAGSAPELLSHGNIVVALFDAPDDVRAKVEQAIVGLP